MEITNGNHNNTPKIQNENLGRNLFLGVLLIGIGVVWLMRNFDLMSTRTFDLILSWQTLLIVIGGYLLSLRNWISGALLVAVGATFLVVDIMGVYVSFSKVVIPTILITAGASIIISRLACKNR